MTKRGLKVDLTHEETLKPNLSTHMDKWGFYPYVWTLTWTLMIMGHLELSWTALDLTKGDKRLKKSKVMI